jgi:NCAIR mutase (PurE)-related protein
MDAADVDEVLTRVASGELSAGDAALVLARLPFGDLGIARIDHHRSLRQGFPEAVYGPGKSSDEVAAIVSELIDHGSGPVLVTRADSDQVDAVIAVASSAGLDLEVTGSTTNSTVTMRPAADRGLNVVVITAGTADGPVADECAAVLAAVGLAPKVHRDRGVAGLHRLADSLDDLTAADATVVVAGMEGALASVVGGIVRGPVVAVPTSVGYGAGLEGVTALLGMLASCAAGVSVVGIDNGFGAAMAVVRALEGR